MERALILSAGRPISQTHLQLLAASTLAVPAAARTSESTATADLPLNLEAAEHALIQRALAQTHGNVAEAARLLNINRSRIYRKFPHAAKP